MTSNRFLFMKSIAYPRIEDTTIGAIDDLAISFYLPTFYAVNVLLYETLLAKIAFHAAKPIRVDS
jgi:hypothetical protein